MQRALWAIEGHGGENAARTIPHPQGGFQTFREAWETIRDAGE
jgi:hypothetical protein